MNRPHWQDKDRQPDHRKRTEAEPHHRREHQRHASRPFQDDLDERDALERMPEQELAELAAIFESRGMTAATALQAAREVTLHDALGAHAREDFPERDDANWMKHTVATFDGWGGQGGGVEIDYRPVHDYTLTDDIEYIKPKKRVY